MNDETLTNETKFRQFLLGEMPEAERLEFEQNFILDEELFENLRVAEDELIENYLSETQCPVNQQKFKTNFLTTEKRRQKVAFTQEMLERFRADSALKKQQAESEGVSVWAGLISLFKQPQIVFGSLFAILVLILGGWFLLRKTDQPVEIVTVPPTPTPTVSVIPTPADSTLNQTAKPDNRNLNQPQPNVNKSNANAEPTPKKIETQSPLVTTLALFTGGVRSEGKTNELNLASNSGGAILQLNLESQDYQIYRAEIIDQNGKVIYRTGNLKANKSKLNTFVPAQNLKRGDYMVKVYGKNAGNQDESAADFQFRVNRN